MSNIVKEFICEEQKSFRVKVGKLLASSLSGFIAGAVFATIFWVVVILFMKYFPVIYQSNPSL